MCLLLFAYQSHYRYPLIIAANRDEFHSRSALPAAFWDDNLLAGKDLVGGGTWLGITRDGKLAALTNYRNPGAEKPNAPSRGKLVVDFLQNQEKAGRFLASLKNEGGQYNGFNR